MTDILLKKIEEAFTEEQFAEAANLLEKLKSGVGNTNANEINRLRLRCFLAANNVKSAQRYVQSLLKEKLINDENSFLLVERAYLKYRQNKMRESLKLLEAHDSSQADDHLISYLKAQVLYKTGEIEEAGRIYIQLFQAYDPKQFSAVDFATNILATRTPEVPDILNMMTQVVCSVPLSEGFEAAFNLKLKATVGEKLSNIPTVEALLEAAEEVDNLDGVVENSWSVRLLQSFLSRRILSNVEGVKSLENESELPDWLKLLNLSNALALGGSESDQNHVVELMLPLMSSLPKLLPVQQFIVLCNLCLSLAEEDKISDAISLLEKANVTSTSLKRGLDYLRATLLARLRKGANKAGQFLKTRINSLSKASLAELNILRDVYSFINFQLCVLPKKKPSPEEIIHKLEEVENKVLIYTLGLNLLKNLPPGKQVLRFLEDGFHFIKIAIADLHSREAEAISLLLKAIMLPTASTDFTSAVALQSLVRLYVKFLLCENMANQAVKILDEAESLKLGMNFDSERLMTLAFVDLESAEHVRVFSSDFRNTPIPVVEPFEEAFDTEMKSSTLDLEKMKLRKKIKIEKARKKRKEGHICKLKERGVDVIIGAKKLDPERWIPAKYRGGKNPRRKKFGKFVGGQGDVNEKEGAKLDAMKKSQIEPSLDPTIKRKK